MRSVLFAANGSIGDLLPIVAVSREVQKRGARVLVAASSPLATAARRLGIAVASVGGAAELATLGEAHADALRFGGLKSIRERMHRHLGPGLTDSLAALDRIADRFVPDLIVSGPFALAAPLLAEARGIPWRVLHPDPALVLRSTLGGERRGSRFGGQLAAELRQVEAARHLSPRPTPSIDWSIPWSGPHLMHDEAMLSSTENRMLRALPFDIDVAGYPLWEPPEAVAGETDRARTFLESGDDNRRAIEEAAALGAPCLVLGQ